MTTPTINRETSPLAGIAMSAYERKKAEHDLRTGEWLADVVIGVFRAPRALFRRWRDSAAS